MRFYAENDMLEDIDAKLRAGSDPNATGPDDDRTPLFWAAWCGHARVITRLLEEPRAKELAMTNCIGLDGIPVAPLSPMEAAHDRWGDESDAFLAFSPVGAALVANSHMCQNGQAATLQTRESPSRAP